MAVATLTEFAERLQAALAAREVGKTQLAAAIGVKPQTVYSWFNENRNPGSRLCRAVADYLRLPHNEVLAWAGHVQRDEPLGDEPGGFIPEVEALLAEFRHATPREQRHVLRGLRLARELIDDDRLGGLGPDVPTANHR